MTIDETARSMLSPHSRFDPEAIHGMDPYGRCFICGITMAELHDLNRDKMMTEAFNRLADVLERLEAKL